jgi:hypothetical protein
MKNLTNFISISFLFLLIVACDGIKKELINLEDIISLTILDKDNDPLQDISVKGDGETLIVLRAQIPENTDSKLKIVTFSTSGGVFVEVSGNKGMVSANSNGVAEIKLKVPLNNTEIFVSAQVTDGSETFTDEKKINLEDVGHIITLNFKNIQDENLVNIPRADGVSIIKLQGNILFNKKALTSIIFNATDGVFLEKNKKTETKNTDINGKAIVNYIVPQTPGAVFFSSKTDETGKYVDDKELLFQRAHGDNIIIEPQNTLMDTINSNTIKVFLKRDIGKVSIGTYISFYSYQIINGSETMVGRFTGLNEAKSDAKGLVSVNFIADTQDFDKKLPIFIKASTSKDDSTVIFEQIEIKIDH